MDDETVNTADYARCLADLETVNRVTFTHRPTLRWLDEVTRGYPPGATLSILDVASGHGDLLRAIHRWAVGRGFRPMLEGIDLNPRSSIAAGLATPPDMGIAWRIGDVFAYAPDPAPDFIVSSQFTHHLTDGQVVDFLRWMERHARAGWFIADLHRHAFPYYGFRLLARLMGWHRIVRYDGTVSIARSFRRAEWERLTAEAGVPATIRWRMAFRYCVGRLK
jgi:2-polyprenyl-3-methyl-5-hydroxy-6-metoxy-1,4-benzoquinol methylase